MLARTKINVSAVGINYEITIKTFEKQLYSTTVRVNLTVKVIS